MISKWKGSSVKLSSLSAVVVLISLASVIAIATVFSGANSQTTPVIISVIALIGTTVPSLLAAWKAEQTANDIRNGVIKNKVKEAIQETIPLDSASATATINRQTLVHEEPASQPETETTHGIGNAPV